MGFDDPFSGYSVVLRVLVYGVTPLFLAAQAVRLRRALHVFQLEGYKRNRFLAWVATDRRRGLFLARSTQKKPLVMTGRAWRLLATALVLNFVAVMVVPGLVHITGGWPYDIPTWTVMAVGTFVWMPRLLVAADVLLAPVQNLINRRFLKRASARLASVAPVVVGITGSFGKTSTKAAIGALLGPPDKVLITPGSFNTPLGVCRTINEQMTPDHRYFVVEMGAYGPGEIAELCNFVHHGIGVLTAIGPAHLERYGSMDAIRKTKYEIVETLPDDGVAIMNVDDPEVRALADKTDHVTVIRYGLDASAKPHVTARDISITARGTSFTIETPGLGRSVHVTTKLLGVHALGHVLASVSVAWLVGRDLDDLVADIEALEPVEHRLQLIEGAGGITVIDDAYNSNPKGAAVALDVLDSMEGARKVVVTPGMVELGDLQIPANRDLGAHAGRVADILIVVARTNREAIVAGATGGKAEIVTVDSLDQAQAELRACLMPGDVVLFENDLPDHYEA